MIFAPAFATASAMVWICSRDSTEHGPAATTTSSPPIFTPRPRSTTVPWPELPAGQLEGLRDAHDFAHAFQQLEIPMIEIAMHADCSQYGVRCAGGTVHVKAAGDQAV